MSVPVLEFELPDHFLGSPEQKRTIQRLMDNRFPYEVDIVWQTTRNPMRALVVPAPEWPAMVKFAEVVPLMESCKSGQILMGMTREGQPFYRSFVGDSPHWSCHINTGLGKSTMFCVTGAQILHQEPDSSLICIDPKQVSFNPLIGIPGVTVHNDWRDVNDMWNGIQAHADILYERMDLMAKDPTLTFPSQVLMLDELGMFANLTRGLWAEVKRKEGRKEQTPPIWRTLADCLYAGRQFSCYVVVMSQRVDDAAIGKLGLLSLFNLKAIAGFAPQDWRRFVGTYPIPQSSTARGRWIYADGISVTRVQNVFSDIMNNPLEVRNYAMSNRSGLISTGKTSPSTGVHWIIGLDEGAEHLGIGIEAFRKRRQRRPIPGEVRTGNRPRWSTIDLDSWAIAEKETVA